MKGHETGLLTRSGRPSRRWQERPTHIESCPPIIATVRGGRNGQGNTHCQSHADSRLGGRAPAASRPLHGGQGMDRSGRCAHAWSERPPVSCRPGDPQRFSLSAAPVEVAGARHNRRSASAASLICASAVTTASRRRWRRAFSRAASVGRCERVLTARIDRTAAEGLTAAQQHAAPGRDKQASRVNGSLRHRLCILLSSRGECGECWVPCRSLPAR